MKIICIGNNGKEDLINKVLSIKSDEPYIYIKPETALLRNKNPFFIPDFAEEYYVSFEFVIKTNKLGKNIAEKYANTYFDEVSIGANIFAVDLLKKLHNQQKPLDLSYTFDNSSPIGEFIKTNEGELYHVEVVVNEDNFGNYLMSEDLKWSVNKIISEISKYYTVKIGDYIFTGSFLNVGPIKINDKIQVLVNNSLIFHFSIK